MKRTKADVDMSVSTISVMTLLVKQVKSLQKSYTCHVILSMLAQTRPLKLCMRQVFLYVTRRTQMCKKEKVNADWLK